MNPNLRFFLKKGDSRPGLGYRVPTAIPDIDTVTFSMKSPTGSLVIDKQPATFSTVGGKTRFLYQWQAGDSATVGDHIAEFEVTYEDGGVESFPNGDNITVRITESVR